MRRLFLSAAAEANRVFRLGCLPGCADAAISAAGVPTQRVVPLPTGAPPRRTTAELAKDRDAYLHVVTLSQYAQIFALSKSNVKAVVMQAVHLAETGQHATVVSTTIKMINTWALHTVSGTTSGVKQTMLDYCASIEHFCNWAATPLSSQPDGVVVPVSRHVVVVFLEFEKERERSTLRRPPKRRRLAPPPPARGSRDADSARAGVTDGESGGGESEGRAATRHHSARVARSSAAVSSAQPDATQSPVHPNSAVGGGLVVAASRGASLPPPMGTTRPIGQHGQVARGAGPRGSAADVNRGGDGGGVGGQQGSTAEILLGRGAVARSAPVGRRGAPALPRVRGRRASLGGQGVAAETSSPANGSAETGVAGTTTTATTPPPPNVGHSTLEMHRNTMSKVESVVNALWSQCACGSCSRFGADAYLSVGSCPAANAVVDQCKRERYLEATALGVGTAAGTRDPALPDDVRLPTVM